METLEDEIVALHHFGGVDTGIATSLLAKVHAARAAMDRGQIPPAVGALNALRQQVTALRGRRIDTKAADALLECIADAIVTLQA